MYLRQKRVGPQAVFTYLIGDREAGEALVIDPAAEARWLVETAARHGLTIKTIVNTHGHADHVCGNAEMKALTKARILLGRGDERYLTGQWAQLSRATGFALSPPPDRLIGDGEEIECGRVSLKILATPGHSPGGICLYTTGHLFSGDTLLAGRAGRTDVPGSSLPDLAASLIRKIMTLPPETVVWPGHQMGPDSSSTIAREIAGNPFYRLLIS